MFFFKNHSENSLTSCGPHLVFSKGFMSSKSKWLAPYFQYVSVALELGKQ